MVSGERPRKQIVSNSALKMSLAFHDGMTAAHWSSVQSMTHQGHQQLEHLPLDTIRQIVWSQFWLWFCSLWDIATQKQAVCLWGQSCQGLEWCHIARLFHRPFPSQRKGQLPAAFVQRHPGDISIKTHQVVGRSTTFSEATLAYV